MQIQSSSQTFKNNIQKLMLKTHAMHHKLTQKAEQLSTHLDGDQSKKIFRNHQKVQVQEKKQIIRFYFSSCQIFYGYLLALIFEWVCQQKKAIMMLSSKYIRNEESPYIMLQQFKDQALRTNTELDNCLPDLNAFTKRFNYVLKYFKQLILDFQLIDAHQHALLMNLFNSLIWELRNTQESLFQKVIFQILPQPMPVQLSLKMMKNASYQQVKKLRQIFCINQLQVFEKYIITSKQNYEIFQDLVRSRNQIDPIIKQYRQRQGTTISNEDLLVYEEMRRRNLN